MHNEFIELKNTANFFADWQLHQNYLSKQPKRQNYPSGFAHSVQAILTFGKR